jgi:erythromycin esterase-like protein
LAANLSLMRRAIFLFITLCLTTVTNAQTDLKDFVAQNAVSISTIEPDSTDYSDLDAIGKAIGNSKIVMLGEQDHGDAPTFLAKTRLIKYLHEKMGFNVAAFESDFFGLNFGFDKLEKTKSNIDSFLIKNIFPIWTSCNTCQNLFYNYIPSTYQTEKPLIITGFDNQLILNFSSKNLVFYLDSLLQSLDIPITRQQNYKSEILPLIDSLKYYSFKDTANYSKCETYLNQIKNQVTSKLSENDFWVQVINSLLAENKEYHLNKIDNITAGNIRDAQMALNLKWLTDVKFPKEKIIVWAANLHVAKYIDSSGKNGRKMISMGSYFTNSVKYLNETYVIGFTSYEGEAGRLGFKTYSVRKPKPNGFENWINKSYNYSFVDFKTYNSKYPDKSKAFYLKALGHNTAFEKDWTKVFDGVFFIREMYPCKR